LRITDRPLEVRPIASPFRSCAYFLPLRALRLQPQTELCLGLVHHTDGVEGTRRRLATASRHAARFSIATECGFGRRDPATIPELLRIHAAVADLE